MDRWQQQRLQQPWCEGQVTPLPSPARGPVMELCQGAAGGGWDRLAFLGSSLRSSAACCRFHPQSHWWVSGHHQSRADGRALWSRQPGFRGQQLHQRCQPSPEHRLWTQPRGECSLCPLWREGDGQGLCLHVVREVSSSRQPLSPVCCLVMKYHPLQCWLCHC